MQHCTSLCDLHNLTISFGLSISSMTLRSHVSMMFLWLLWSDLDSKKLTQSYCTVYYFSRSVIGSRFIFLAKI